MATFELPNSRERMCLTCISALSERLPVDSTVAALVENCSSHQERARVCEKRLRLVCPFLEDAEAPKPGAGTVVCDAVRRVFDICVGLIGLALLLILLPFLAVAIRMQSPGPIFFSQERVGRNGRVFRISKLRTMHNRHSDDEARWATDEAEEARIFPLGGFLRRTHIDELPQFWNVLIGEMSLIGPRPEQVPIVHRLEEKIPGYHRRHSIRPGITGLAQVQYGYVGSDIGTWLKVAFDLYYIAHRGPLLDLFVLARTVPRVLAEPPVTVAPPAEIQQEVQKTGVGHGG
ncbi:MAG: sugar transferase [candidate division WS1 bacterium]|nr:sugar transferase [candidate division WS1 bacterium]